MLQVTENMVCYQCNDTVFTRRSAMHVRVGRFFRTLPASVLTCDACKSTTISGEEMSRLEITALQRVFTDGIHLGGDEFRDARKILGFSKNEFAQALGLPEDCIEECEKTDSYACLIHRHAILRLATDRLDEK